MKGKVHRTGLRITSILVAMVVGVVAVVANSCVFVFFNRYRKAMVLSAQTSSAQAVSQVSNTVGNYLQDMNEAMKIVERSMTQSAQERDKMLTAFLEIRPDVVAVTSYDAQGNLLQCWARGRQLREKFLRNLSFDLETARATNQAYITAPHVESIFKGYYPWVVTLTQPLPSGGQAAWVSLDLSFSSISNSINAVSIGQRGYCFLMDQQGNIVYHPQQQLIYAGLKSENTAALAGMQDAVYAEDTVIHCIKSVPQSNWRVVGVSYVDELVNRGMQEMIRLSVLLAGVVLATALLTSWLLSRLLARPLCRLAAAMESFESDADGFTHRSVGGTKEVQELSDSFGHMVVRIQQLMTTVRQEEVNLRKTELKALQAQINPHFLYNTLDSIAWMCERGRNTDAVHMVHALARLFRISISKGQELIPIAKELEHAQSYLQIQAYRYKNQFTYSFDVDPECLSYYCNKITLQPIIENAIYHGLGLMVDEGEIEVKVRRDGDDIVFSVRDNGMGMSPEQVAVILEKGPKDRTGIGIKNVNDRLKIYFGKNYGLSITSELDVGTCVEIRMPRIQEGENESK